MQCLALLFDAMSGVKKLRNFILAITSPTSANEPSFNQVPTARRQLLYQAEK